MIAPPAEKLQRLGLACTHFPTLHPIRSACYPLLLLGISLRLAMRSARQTIEGPYFAIHSL